MVTIISKSPEETEQLGAQWGRAASPGWLIGLTGKLGAGKTQLVKGLAVGLGIKDRIASPTFTLVHEYESGRLPLCHIDLYRLNTRSQIIAAGLEEYFYAPRGVTVVEWIDRWFGPGYQPQTGGVRVRMVRIEVPNERERQISYEDFGA